LWVLPALPNYKNIGVGLIPKFLILHQKYIKENPLKEVSFF
jgi:hypothetical protein